MADKSKRQQRIAEERKRDFMVMFSRESELIRNSIVKDLPAYNMLLSIQAESFEEIALRLVAKERRLDYNKFDPPMPTCPHCGSYEKVGKKNGLFFCYSCQKKFAANYSSISSGTKCDALIWMKVLQCILDFTGVNKTCEYCGIARETYYNLRNRLLYGMQLLLDEIKLYGNIQVDNTFVRASYKGSDLSESEFTEDSIFYDETFKPRAARKRGGAYAMIDKNANQVCIFTAIDDRGHVLARFAGIGATSFRVLKENIPAEKFLPEVPQKDPFGDLVNTSGNKDPKTKPGAKTLMIADKEKAIERYAKHIGVDFESHVFRKKGVQRRLSDDAHNIQKVNALHRRLKNFLRNSNFPSTKYLPGHLILFEFIENTGASKETIERLFQILAQPNLGKSTAFFEDMYTVPNYLLEWIDGDHPLKKLPAKKLLAFYLYDHIRRKEDHPDDAVTMKDIERETGYTEQSIRRNYNDLCKAGYREMILRFFGHENVQFDDADSTIEEQKPRKNAVALTSINPIMLAIFDEYAEMRMLPPRERKTQQQFVDDINERYGTNYTRTNLLAKFDIIVKYGAREPLPEIKHFDRYMYEEYLNKKYPSLLEDYNSLMDAHGKKGKNHLSATEICEILSTKYNLGVQTIQSYISYIRRYKKRSGQ